VIGISTLTWDSLTPADRDIVTKTAREVATWEKAAARKGLDGSTEAIDVLRKEGMDVVVLSTADTVAFRDRTRSVYDRWAGEIGTDLVKSAEQIIGRAK
jgi:TRAP-type transport system periplasmic protein